jgi:hypothetical protein
MTNQDQPPPAGPTGGPATEPLRSPTFEERVERFGQEAEDAGKRFAANPAVKDAADTAARVWGLLLIAVGAWFLAEFTLGYDLPSIPWRDVWPIGLIVIGLAVILRGMMRRNA